MGNLNVETIVALPFALLSAEIVFILLAGLFRPAADRSDFTIESVVCVILAWTFCASSSLLNGTAFGGQVVADGIAFFFHTLILGGVIFTLLLNSGQLKGQGVRAGSDVTVLVLLSALGGMVMVSAANLIVFFLGLELLSISLYVLAGLARDEQASSEAALKYFLLGVSSSACLLYGMMLLYGATGTLSMPGIAQALSETTRSNPMALVGIGLVLFGLAFKASLVPFHFWAPDVYQGSPVSLVVYMAAVVKAAAFGAMLRVLAQSFEHFREQWIGVLIVLCLLTMTVANLAALRQRSVKRLLAYSSIAHAGYILIGFIAGQSGGWEASMYYLVVYALMTVGSFGVVLVVTAQTAAQYSRDDIDALRGLGWSNPFLGIALSVAVLSLAGFPPLGGFFGKLYLFLAGIRAGYTWLVLVAVLNSLVSLYYYLSILVAVYFTDRREDQGPIVVSKSRGSQIALALATIGTLLVGVYSDRLMEVSRAAVDSLPHHVAVVSLPQR